MLYYFFIKQTVIRRRMKKRFCMSEVYPDSKRSLRKRNNLKTLTNKGTHLIMSGFCSMKQLHASPLPEIPKNFKFLNLEIFVNVFYYCNDYMLTLSMHEWMMESRKVELNFRE